MKLNYCTSEVAQAVNDRFEREVYKFLKKWLKKHEGETLLWFDQTLDEYLSNDALRDFFLNTEYPLQELLKKRYIFRHLSRSTKRVYFDEITGDPLLSKTEQRIYNLARRMESERMHVPFRSIHPDKQTAAGDVADISTYPEGSEELRYNSGNHFSSRPANNNVFDENSRRCVSKANGRLQVMFRRGFLENRLQDVKVFTAAMQQAGQMRDTVFVIYSRHSPKEGHYGVSLVVMDPANPDFPKRVLVCDTLLKDLPHHPRWWPHFVEEFSNVFGVAIAEIIEDISHPLQKVNIKGDDPYRHDWDCPYYAAAMADALADLTLNNLPLILNGTFTEIHSAMKTLMSDYYHPGGRIKDRQSIQIVNKLKRWNSGRELIKDLAIEVKPKSAYEY
ncbi:hypothetical protein [Mucilaginibacter sp. KACC 22063]|uniref:hypothetical protein n=1 Tax=Mucilaginibacter sp. KACC 22063 TaxID=3025666 RepID=UPI00236582AF|nr:hypothetical protein [Mucilaginibacter sp. KACC 22063]WDF54325.1 hypothetical protein PQ461_15375 [Mucilaginibacter sp. KACC 22063]